jgi:hypothetical protein
MSKKIKRDWNCLGYISFWSVLIMLIQCGLKGRDHLELLLGVDGKIILRWI